MSFESLVQRRFSVHDNRDAFLNRVCYSNQIYAGNLLSNHQNSSARESLRHLSQSKHVNLRQSQLLLDKNRQETVVDVNQPAT